MKKIRHIARCGALLAATHPFTAHAAFPVQNATSLQGYTGALNVPSAFTVAHGVATVQFSDAIITGSRRDHNDNLVGNFGLLPFLEAGGRFSWDNTHDNCFRENCGIRDLSANAKLRLPFIPEDWFALAFGAQDISGEANHFTAQYAVASKQFHYGRIDIGAGKADQPNRFLDGAFASVEIQPSDWLGVILEHDGQDSNAGFRLGLPVKWQPKGINTELKVLAYSNAENSQDQRFFGLSVNIPLGEKKQHRAERYAHATSKMEATENRDIVEPQTEAPHYRQSQEHTPHAENNDLHASIAARLAAERFENIQVGERSGILYVAYENNQFNRNEMDALGLVLKRVSEMTLHHFKTISVIILNESISVAEVSLSPAAYLTYLHDESGNATLQVDARQPDNDLMNSIAWTAEAYYGQRFKPRLTLSPGVSTAVATELGMLDYSLSLQTDAALSLWKGALFAATYNMPVDQTDDYERDVDGYRDPGAFYSARQQSGFEEYEIQQTAKLASGIFSTLHGGRYNRDFDGFYHQTAWLSESGTHKISLRNGFFENESDNTDDREINLVGYRYFLHNHDVSVETTFGEFWDGDEGYRIDTRFWFGDTAISLEYKDTDAQFVGMRWTLPLTPRRDMITNLGQIKGKENWSYGLQNRINEDVNVVSFTAANMLRTRNELERTYFNNDRLSPGYITTHLRRIKDAANNY